ncbi:MAG: PQQ-binding-like beta-propeller repeat protein [Planctomycetota bacterium]
MSRRVSAVIMIVSLFLGVRVLAGDWAHWRGPYLNGSADEKNLPATWSKTQNVVWVASLPGHSSATPVIAGGKVFLSSTDRESDNLFALCLDARTGKELWRRKLGASGREVPRNNLATPSPVTDGRCVYFMYGSGDLAGLDGEGNVLWSRNIEAEYGNISVKYGYSSSPLLHGGKLYVLVQRCHTAYRSPKSTALDAFILAVDPKTGTNIFKQPRQSDAQDESLDSYSSPLLFQHDGREELVVIGADYVTANDPKTGKEVWRYEYVPEKITRGRNISSPGIGEGLLFGARPRGGTGLFALRGGGEGTLAEEHVAWTFDGPTPDVCTPLYYKGNVYILDGKSSGVLTCLDASTGRQKWQGKLSSSSAPWRASVTAADDKLYCISEAGEAVVLAADDGEFKLLSRIDMEDKPIQASIAIADGRLFIRTANQLFCIGN